ncbi:SMY2 [Sanghuangporus weigelae]
MTSTTMHFGPEWMRKQPAPAKPLATSPPPSGATSYSALVTPHAPPVQGKRDIAHPFKYSRDEMLQVFKDLGGCSELPIEVERWDGVVRESSGEPVSLSDFTEVERKLYATSLNSENRRRQPSDYVAQGDRSKGGTLNSGLGLLSRRRRGDSNGAEQTPISLPRKTSWSGASGNLVSPSAASPRTRIGGHNAIDGVLNGSESAWGGGKRRVTSGHPIPDRLDEKEVIQKEAPPESNENTHSPAEKTEGTENRPPDQQDSSTSQVAVPQNPDKDIDNVTGTMNNLALNTNAVGPQKTDQVSDARATDAEPGKVEWSYIDPSGTVQGPFPAEQMQLWNDQGYFSDNLLMKRIHMDTGFAPLTDIKRRAQGERVFLSPLIDALPPPGLSHPVPAPAFNPILQRTGLVDLPRQSSPQSYGNNNTLDSFNVNGSITGSPSSSLGGSFARGPISPDPIAIGSRFQRFDAVLNGRVSAAGSYSSSGSPAMPHAVRQTFNDAPQPNRTSSIDVPANVPWQLSNSNVAPGWNGPPDVPQLGRFDAMPPSFRHAQFGQDPSSYALPTGPNPVEHFFASPGASHRFYEPPEPLGTAFHQIPHESPSRRFEGAPRQPPLPQLNTGFVSGFDQMPSPAASIPNMRNTSNFQQQSQARSATSLSPWGASQPHELPRPRPFDADMPTAKNTYVMSPPQPQVPAWNKPQDSWASVSQTAGQDRQSQMTEESRSLTTANVTQHNEQQRLMASGDHSEQQAATSQVDSSVPTTMDIISHVPEASVQSRPLASAQETSRLPTSKSKARATPPKASETSQNTSATATSKTASAPPASQKAPWATDDEGKTKQPAPMNLRAIQEAEKKRQETRKNTDKGRERVSRAASGASPTEEVQFSASWGLPTSQVGSRSSGVPSAKETPVSPTSSTPSGPVWTNAAKPAAKTMKEIQEEEERRKQVARERETAATAVKRAAAQQPIAKAPIVASQASGGVWHVVGSGGKRQTAASVAASRPAAVAQASTPNAQAPSSRSTAVHRTMSSQAVAKATSPALRTDEEPAVPSLEFMKWMRESLRGLNSSVQFEEIAQMLLSFPLDPDKATKEIIAETVYGASTTLNGRDYAEEFVKKRKEDVLSRSKGSSGQAANGKPASLADVVKAQPKQPQNDFGSFKVVKKKNKRS